ncbi:MAG: hypothetical protein K0S41_2944 [Anaerocolumna sp.]|jgi:uncharacterized glyoxalase superfamily protein PhnB|nr:hypothetical protein [Anaerocolumna sp.]
MLFTGPCIITNQVATVSKFYDMVLGTTSDINDVHTVIETEGAKLIIYSREAAKEDMGLLFGEGPSQIILQFLVDDVDVHYEKLKQLDVHFINPPKTYPWGGRSMQFKDPDGNVVNFACNVK